MIIGEELRSNINLAISHDRSVCVWGTGYVSTGPGREMLNKLGISVDHYFDNESSKWGLEIVDGIKCKAGNEIDRDAVVFIMIATVDSYSVKKMLVDMGIRKIVMYDELCAVAGESFFDFQKKKQIAVYSCVVGDYDNICNPISVNDECDYFLITDKRKDQDNIYTYIDVNDVVPKTISDPTRKNRFCKLLPHNIFPDYKYSIYFDGCASLRSEIVNSIGSLPECGITMLMKTKATVYSTIYKNIIHERDDVGLLTLQGSKYWNEGLPDDFGILHPGIMVRMHNNPICKKIMEDWWNEVEKYSCRDMVSLPYVLWKNGYSVNDVGLLIEQDQIWNNYWGEWNGKHAKKRKQKQY